MMIHQKVIYSIYVYSSFFGPTVGGLCVEWFGFPWTATAVALVHALFVCFLYINEKIKYLQIYF